MNNKTKIILFPNCIPIKGVKRSIIYDLQRSTYDFIPNSLYIILNKHNRKSSIDDIKKEYNYEYNEIIDEYFNFLEKKEYIFYSNEPYLFPKINFEWDFPAHITNAIIDLNKESVYDFQNIFSDLDILGCQAIEIRFFDVVTFEFIDKILFYTLYGRIRNIELILKYSHDFKEDKLLELCKKHKRINSISIHSSQERNTSKFIEDEQVILNYTTEILLDNTHCGIINHQYFMVNIELFSESKNYNSCLNRKIGIDINGEIKNCPSMKKSYGNIKDTTIMEAINKEGFKDLWNIKKEQIEICKVCEFRYMCTDCRAFIEDESNIYSKPAKCNYNPYTATWEDKNITHNILRGN